MKALKWIMNPQNNPTMFKWVIGFCLLCVALSCLRPLLGI